MKMYFIAIVAPPEINRKFLTWKSMMRDRYQCQVALRSPAHITLVPPFWLPEEKEQVLKSGLSGFCESQDVFLIEIEDFSCFPPRVIFAEIKKSDALELLFQKLNKYLLSKEEFSIRMNDQPFHPHITIASRDLYKKAFHEAWGLFSEKEYRDHWLATGVSLLRHNQKKWDVIFTSPFRKNNRSR